MNGRTLLHDTSNATKGELMEIQEMSTQAYCPEGFVTTQAYLLVLEENTRLRAALDISVPVTPPTAWVCACDKPDQRCTVHGWVLRSGGAR